MNAFEQNGQDLDKTVVAEAVNPDATLLGTTITCPVCATENAPNEKYCGECGFLLSSTPGETVEAVPAVEQPRLVDSTGLREHLLRLGENTVGREGTDVLLVDSTVSRRHAMIILEDAKAWLEDLGSTNGTFVEGKQIQPGERVELADGTDLKFGSAILTLKLPVISDQEEEIAEQETAEEQESAPRAEVEAEPIEAAEAEEEPEIEAATEVKPAARLISADLSVEFAIVPGENTVGRREGNDIVISADPYVSGSHAVITADGQGFWLTDLGSTNGTSLNGAPLAPDAKMALTDGDDITMGKSGFKFAVAEVEADLPEDEDGAED